MKSLCQRLTDDYIGTVMLAVFILITVAIAYSIFGLEPVPVQRTVDLQGENTVILVNLWLILAGALLKTWTDIIKDRLEASPKEEKKE